MIKKKHPALLSLSGIGRLEENLINWKGITA
jgi:hypothetical protein